MKETFMFGDWPVRQLNGMQCSTICDVTAEILKDVLPGLSNRYSFGANEMAFGKGKVHSEQLGSIRSEKEEVRRKAFVKRYLDLIRLNLNTAKEVCYLRISLNKLPGSFKEVNIDINDIQLYDEFSLEPYTIYRFVNRKNPRSLPAYDHSRLIHKANSDPHAQFVLGEMYEKGELVHVDWRESFKWYMRAMNNGNKEAFGKLAHMYLNGRGTTQNFQRAFKLGQLGARAGDAGSKYVLGCMYIFGRGYHEDRGAGRRWLMQAAEKGHGDAQFQIAMMYMNGLGGMQTDTESGRMWMERAYASGNSRAVMFV
jgi:FOG: TPR repeat, SEL1 subfamily